MPIFHECQRCTECCRWPGEVKLSEEEITRIAIHLRMDELEFIERYTRLRMFRTGLSLAEKPNGECIFLDGVDCRIQSVKPQQCRDFPNLWNFPGWQKSCQAIPRVVSEPEYSRLIFDATGRKLPGQP